MTAEHRGVTVFVPALNEAAHLPNTIENVISANKQAGNPPLEILVFNDGSSDNSAEVIGELEKKYKVIRAIHHPVNTGWGVSFKEAIELAKYPKMALYPGDGMVSTTTLRDMIKNAYRADFICSYTTNTDARTAFRVFVSSLYTKIYLLTFRVPIRYINATPVYPVELLRQMVFRCERYSFPSEVNVKVLRTGCRFMEIPGMVNPKNMGSSAIGLGNLWEVILNYSALILDIYVRDRRKYSYKPVRVE